MDRGQKNCPAWSRATTHRPSLTSSALILAMTAAAAIDKAMQLAQADGVKFRRTALYVWQKLWENGGLIALVPKRKRASKAIRDPFIDRVNQLSRAVRGRRLTACYRDARHEFAGKRRRLPSYRTVHRLLSVKRKPA